MRSIPKFLVAAAIASACGYAAASTVSVTTPGRYGLESLANSGATDDIVVNDVKISINDSFASQDYLLISTNRTFGSLSLTPATISCSVAATAGASVTFSRSPGAASNASSIRYNYASGGSVSTDGALCTGAGATGTVTLSFRGSAAATVGDITVNVRRIRNADGASLDVSTDGKVASVGAEYTVTVSSALDGQIDVQGGRLSFVTGGAETTGSLLAGYVDKFAVSVNRDSRIQIVSVTGSLSVTLTAGSSFGFLADPEDTAGSCTVASGSGQAVVVANPVIASPTVAVSPTSGTCNVLTATFNTFGDGGSYAIYLGRTSSTASVNTAFAAQAYTAGSSAVTTAKGNTAATLASGTSAGSWTLNGTTVNIPYLPLTTSSVQVFVANRSTQSGAVAFTAWNASGTQCTGSLGNIGANANGSFGATLKAALQACTGTGWSDAARATVQLTMPTPSLTTTVHTGFSATDSTIRTTVVNDTNGK